MNLAEEVGWVVCYVELSTGFILLCIALYLLIKTKKKKVSNLLLIHLFTTELVSILWEVTFLLLYQYKPFLSKLQSVQFTGVVFVGYTRCQSVLWITVDRFLAVRLGLKYRAFATNCKLMSALILVWTISITHSLISWFAPIDVTILILVIWNAGMVMIIVISYLYIIVAVKTQRRKLNTDTTRGATTHFKYRVPFAIGFFYTVLCLVPKLIAYFTDLEFSYSWLYVGLILNFNTDPITYLLHGTPICWHMCPLSDVKIRSANMTKVTNIPMDTGNESCKSRHTSRIEQMAN